LMNSKSRCFQMREQRLFLFLWICARQIRKGDAWKEKGLTE
jgi:hypothetical protein